MKKVSLTTVIALFFLLISNGILAQTTQAKLNQLELIKQFIGRWKAEMGKDTTVLLDAKLFGTGLEDNWEFVTNGKSYFKIKGLFGYDNKNDKFIHLKVYDPFGSELNAFWFSSNNIFEGVPYQYISNPDNAPLKWKMEIKSLDTVTLSTTLNKKVVSILTLTPEK